jgi:hypothetical protein
MTHRNNLAQINASYNSEALPLSQPAQGSLDGPQPMGNDDFHEPMDLTDVASEDDMDLDGTNPAEFGMAPGDSDSAHSSSNISLGISDMVSSGNEEDENSDCNLSLNDIPGTGDGTSPHNLQNNHNVRLDSAWYPFPNKEVCFHTCRSIIGFMMSVHLLTNIFICSVFHSSIW